MNAACLIVALTCSADPSVGLKMPDGFVVSLFAGPELANDIFCLHVDSTGRVLVAGRGYVRHLIDTNADGKADQAIDGIPPPNDGPMGLLWEGDTLFVMSDGGLKRYRKVDGKAPTTEKPELLLKLGTGGEHSAHAVRRGPDGKLWVLCGNMAGVGEKTITSKDSPVKKPIAGCLLRMNDDGTDVEVIADGFRNPYDFDFDLRGTPYTYDSDNERCVGLPWYEFTRFYRVPVGGNHGWLSPQQAQTWRKPPYFADVVAPFTTPGRGSPTGVACYRHTRFPKPYRGGLFYADWTFGKIWFTHPDDKEPRATAFLEATGENGFAPTGLAVHPKSGDLFVSIGGRGTRGAVYRITSTKAHSGEPLPFEKAALPKWEAPSAFPWKATDLADAKTVADKLRVVRGWQRAMGDLVDPRAIGTVWEGYSLRDRSKKSKPIDMLNAASDAFPSGDANLDRELTRLLAAFEEGGPELISKVTAHLSKLADPVERVHYLIVLGRLHGDRTSADTARVADVLVSLDGEFEKRSLTRDTNWPLRMTETVTTLSRHDPKLIPTLIAHPAFGSAEHVWLARLPGMDRWAAAKAFVLQSAKIRDYPWTAGHVEFVAELPEVDRRALLLKLYDRGFADAVVSQLAKNPKPEDRERFVKGLSSGSAAVVSACAKALTNLPTMGTDEFVPLIRSLRRFADPKTDTEVRKRVFALLKLRTDQSFDDVTKWEAWLTETHPELAKKLTATGYDATAWKKRLAEVNWDAGDAGKGRVLFAKAQCAACHNGGNAVGPSLAGVGKRFSRDDLLTAVLDPNRDISPRYRTTRFTTTDDKVYEGIIIYEATDGVILHTGTDTTVRIAGKMIDSKKPGTLSLMPTGLLDAFTATEVADLFAYLKELH
jgi:putative heme-binding domain-containing protein